MVSCRALYYYFFLGGGGGNVGGYALMVVLTESDRPLSVHASDKTTRTCNCRPRHAIRVIES